MSQMGETADTSSNTLRDLPGVVKATADAVKASVEAIQAVENALDSPRSVVIEVDNLTNLTLVRVSDEHSHGGFGTTPKGEIPPKSNEVFGSRSTGIFTGTEGSVTYSAGGLNITVHWDNPFAGSNSCSANLSGQHTSRFRILTACGAGNHNAQMRYVFFEQPGPFSVRQLLVAKGFEPGRGIRSHLPPGQTSLRSFLGL